MNLTLAIVGTLCFLLTLRYIHVGLVAVSHKWRPGVLAVMVFPMLMTAVLAAMSLWMLWDRI